MLLSKIERDILEFARRIKRIDLAGIVMDLYDAALQESSRKQYGTGQRAYLRFSSGIPTSGFLLPFPRRQLQRTELMLAFFITSYSQDQPLKEHPLFCPMKHTSSGVLEKKAVIRVSIIHLS